MKKGLSHADKFPKVPWKHGERSSVGKHHHEKDESSSLLSSIRINRERFRMDNDDDYHAAVTISYIMLKFNSIWTTSLTTFTNCSSLLSIQKNPFELFSPNFSCYHLLF